MMSEDMNDYVESKIRKYNFFAKNFSKEDMNIVDTYCKDYYDNNRKLMIMDLIRYKEENIPITLLNDKINMVFETLSDKIKKQEVKEEKKPKISKWKGFSKENK